MIALGLNDEVRNAADVALVVGSRLGETDWWGKAPNWAPPGQQVTIQIDNDEDRHRREQAGHCGAARRCQGGAAGAGRCRGGPRRCPQPGRAFGEAARLAGAVGQGAGEARQAPEQAGRPGASGARADHRPAGHAAGLVWVFDGGNTAVWANFYHDANVPRTVLSTFKFGMLGAGMGQALGSGRRCPRPAGLRAHRRRCLRHALQRGRDRGTAQPADRVRGAGRRPVGDGEDEPADRGPPGADGRAQDADRLQPARRTRSCTPISPPCRYDLMAEAFGAYGELVTDTTDLRGALERARDCGKPAVVQVQVDNVEHLWAPGLQSFKKMHQEPEGLSPWRASRPGHRWHRLPRVAGRAAARGREVRRGVALDVRATRASRSPGSPT